MYPVELVDSLKSVLRFFTCYLHGPKPRNLYLLQIMQEYRKIRQTGKLIWPIMFISLQTLFTTWLDTIVLVCRRAQSTGSRTKVTRQTNDLYEFNSCGYF